tara:strand:- start:1026 stop:2825 length:1800 start_codon:yes stop_codon:yes gene_type:complete
MITLKTLRWDNCFSYGENNQVDLSDNKLTQIIGINGVGKSSIPLILEEILFNKNSKGVKKADIANRNVGKGYTIFLSFEKDEEEYEIHLDRKNSLKLKLLKDGQDISSHTATNTYKTLNEIIGIDFKTFSQVVYQNTNASLQFLTATDTNRKKFLIDLLNLDEYVELFETFKVESKNAEDALSVAKGKLSTIEKWLENNKLTSMTPKVLLNLPKPLEEDEKSLRQLLTELENISSKNKKISQNNQYKNLLKGINITEINKIEISEKESYDYLQEKSGSLGEAIRTQQQAVRKIEGLDNTCPTCGQSITEEFKHSHINEAKTEIELTLSVKTKTDNMIALIKKKNQLYDEKMSKQEEWEKLYRSIDKDLPSQLLDKQELEDKILQYRAKIDDVNQEIDRLEKENREITAYNTRIEVIKEQTQEFTNQLNEVKKEIEVFSEKATNLEILKKAFSTNGLIAYKLENMVKELEELTNEYLAELSDGRFTLEFVVSNDRLNVQITDNAKVVDILALSSGELARVNTSTLLAIRKLMNSLSSSKVNVLFLDEVINVLDSTGRDKLVEVLLEENLNTYLVSHQWEHPLLTKMHIYKDGNLSAIEIE